MRKKILLLNQTFYPDNAATAQHLTDLAVDLVKVGHSVWVLCDRRSYDDRNMVHVSRENYKGVNIARVGSSAFGKKTRYHRFLDYISFNMTLAWKLFSLPKFDFVVGLTSPPWISFFGALFVKLKGGRFIHWAMDINPDQAVELGWVKKNSLSHHILNWMAMFTYNNSDMIVCLDRFMRDRLIDKCVNPSRIRVVSPWSPDMELSPVNTENNPFRIKYGLNGRFVVMYSGNLSVCHPLETILETARLMKDNDRVHFLFVGGGLLVKDVLEFKDRHKLSNIQYLPYQPRSDINDSLTAADLHMVVMGEKYVGIIHPCKIYGVLNAGRPFILIGPGKTHVGDIIREAVCGFQVDHGDAGKLVSIIQEAMTLKGDKLEEIRQKNRSLVESKYSRKALTEKIINLCIK